MVCKACYNLNMLVHANIHYVPRVYVCVCMQVVRQHGGGVVDSPEHCTHLLALHKKSLVFARVSHSFTLRSSVQTPTDITTLHSLNIYYSLTIM